MSANKHARNLALALCSALLLVAFNFRPARAAQDGQPRESREPVFLRVGDDGRIIVKQEGKEREYALLGVEWPADEAHREEANTFLKRLLGGETLRIEPREQKYPTSKPSKDDAAAAMPAYVRRAPDGLLVNAEVIRLGYARVAAKPAFEQLAGFREFEKRARDEGKGVWSDDAPPAKRDRAVPRDRDKPADGNDQEESKQPAAGSVVYITPSGDRYHLKSCQYARNARAVSISEAIQLGKTPCSRCKPPAKP